MKTLTKEIWMEVPQRRGIVSLHGEIERLVQQSGVAEGLLLIYRFNSSNHRSQR